MAGRRESGLAEGRKGAAARSSHGAGKKGGGADDGKPYDPYGGVSLAPSRVDLAPEKLQSYSSEWLGVIRTKAEFRVGGYSADEYLTRALFEAFSGLGVFVDEERMEKAAEAAAEAAGKMEVDETL